MPRIELILEDNLPRGVVRAQDGFWKGEALVCSRSTIEEALRGDTLDVSGVYVLSGIERSGESALPKDVLYIGSGDTVRDRISSHIRQLFWRTAIVFHRPGQALHYGNIRYIEARLIDLAGANGVPLDNRNSPALPRMPDGAKAESEQYVEHIILYLRALGLDYFSTQVATVPESGSQTTSDPIDTIPGPLRSLISMLRVELEGFPNAEFYATRTPDVRAKVTIEGESRVFARMQPRKDGVRLELRDLDFMEKILATDEGAITRLRPQLSRAYERAVEVLQGKA